MTNPAIGEFLAQRRIAVVGVSRNPKDFTRGVYREFARRGYEVVPVNPLGGELDGRPCAARVQDIAPPVDAALVLTPPAITDQVVRDCAEAGVKRVWMHRGSGRGAVSPAAVAFCRERGMSVVDGACPFMFLAHAGLVHRVHRVLRSWFGRQPQPA